MIVAELKAMFWVAMWGKRFGWCDNTVFSCRLFRGESVYCRRNVSREWAGNRNAVYEVLTSTNFYSVNDIKQEHSCSYEMFFSDFDDTNFGDVPMYFTFRSAVDAFAQERQHDTVNCHLPTFQYPTIMMWRHGVK